MRDFITVVSGLPRSGTSMMMKMLEAGGLPLLTDGVRAADEDNPKGYHELEKVKDLERDAGWMAEAKGRVVKVISELLKSLPGGFTYRVVFMRRKLDEVLLSQREMLIRRGTLKEGGPSDERMKELLIRHVEETFLHIKGREDMRAVLVDYNRIFVEPDEYIDRVNEFLGGGLDTGAMKGVIDERLYRQRSPD